MKKSLILLAFWALFTLPATAASVTIEVRSQAEFDGLNAAILTALRSGSEEITVQLGEGVYFFSEKHINLNGLSYPGATVILEGNGAVLIGGGDDLMLRKKKKGRFTASYAGYDWRRGVIDLDRLEDVPPFGALRQAQGPVEILDAGTGLCRFKAPETAIKAPKGMMVQFSSWYQGMTCPVQKIEGGFLYFKVPQLSQSGGYYNVEGDRQYGGTYPKYQLINSPEAPLYWDGNRVRAVRKGRYHFCRNSQFLFVGNCAFKSFELRHFRFLGNSDTAEILFHFHKTKGRLAVAGCTFNGIRNLILSCADGASVQFLDNVSEGNYRGTLRADRESSGVQVLRNIFRNNQLLLNNTFDVICRGKDLLVKDNTFCDFTYGAIGLGSHFMEDGPAVCSGIVEDNEIFYTAAYRKEPSRTLMDSGAIYLWTKQNGVTVRNNYIHDYTGSKDNRGIFGDDGTINATVTGNRILRIGNSYCIDFRRVESVETRSDSKVKKTNIGIKMYDNTVDGSVRFEPRPGDRTSRKGVNKNL